MPLEQWSNGINRCFQLINYLRWCLVVFVHWVFARYVRLPDDSIDGATAGATAGSIEREWHVAGVSRNFHEESQVFCLLTGIDLQEMYRIRNVHMHTSEKGCHREEKPLFNLPFPTNSILWRKPNEISRMYGWTSGRTLKSDYLSPQKQHEIQWKVSPSKRHSFICEIVMFFTGKKQGGNLFFLAWYLSILNV